MNSKVFNVEDLEILEPASWCWGDCAPIGLECRLKSGGPIMKVLKVLESGWWLTSYGEFLPICLMPV